LEYSERAPEFFGYTHSEFAGLKSVKEIIPQIIANQHDTFIQRLINEGTGRILRKYRLTVAKDKKGFLIPINIYVNYFFNL
jgi:hypothetical protein